MSLPIDFVVSVDLNARLLQFELPDYTSPPLPDALAATPEAFRSDQVIDAMREMDASDNCTATSCHIPFEPEQDPLPLGVVLYGGALVDPRSYSVLAEPLLEYGITTVIPVFDSDLAFSFQCGSGRVEFAQQAYPDIDMWLLVGHSFGGIAANTDAWLLREDPSLAGVVLLAADVQPMVCGPTTLVDFSDTDIPMAAVTATEDLIINMTRWEENTRYLSNSSILVEIQGGNHGQFASYNDTLRTPILGQVDGEATISPQEQWDQTIETILAVAGIDDIPSPSSPPSPAPTTAAPPVDSTHMPSQTPGSPSSSLAPTSPAPPVDATPMPSQTPSSDATLGKSAVASSLLYAFLLGWMLTAQI